MQFTRRGIAYSVAIPVAGFISAAVAQSGEEAAVNQAIEAMRKAMVEGDRAKLEALVADQLSYGHSAGVIENKQQFLDVIASKKTTYKSITLVEPTVTVVGNNAIARHIFTAEFETDGKPGTARVGVLQVWAKQDATWKLLARQAFRLS
jgi:ketosteroid isomerase-like protein